MVIESEKELIQQLKRGGPLKGLESGRQNVPHIGGLFCAPVASQATLQGQWYLVKVGCRSHLASLGVRPHAE